MQNDFGVFIQDKKGPLRCGAFADQEEAKRTANEIAKNQRVECFVYSFKTLSEVARFLPTTTPVPD